MKDTGHTSSDSASAFQRAVRLELASELAHLAKALQVDGAAILAACGLEVGSREELCALISQIRPVAWRVTGTDAAGPALLTIASFEPDGFPYPISSSAP